MDEVLEIPYNKAVMERVSNDVAANIKKRMDEKIAEYNARHEPFFLETVLLTAQKPGSH